MLLIAVIFIIVFAVYLHVKFYKKAWDAGMKVPGPNPYPFIGNILEVAFLKPSEYLQQYEKYGKTYGNRYRVFLGNHLILGFVHPNDAQVITTSPDFLNKSTEYKYLLPWLGTGLLLSSGDKWKNHRKAITPGFHFRILNNFVPIVDQQIDILIEQLKGKADGSTFDVYPFMNACALDIICETAMGTSINAQSTSESEYVEAVNILCNLVNQRLRNPLKRYDFFFKMTNDYKNQQKYLKILHSFTDNVIKKRKAWLEGNDHLTMTTITEEFGIYGIKNKMAFLDILLLCTIDGKPLSDLDIRQEVDTFMFEGHDTVSSTLAFTLYELSKHPDIQEKIYMEQMEIFPDNEQRPVTQSDIQNGMKYLDLVMKECLRMYPPVPIIGRQAIKDTYINDVFVPKDASVGIPVISMHKNPEFFPEPERFIPERYLPEAVNNRHPFSTLAFSAGSRNCIGQKFAILEVKAIVSKVVRNYKIESSGESLILTGDLILKSMNGVPIKLIPRT